MLWINICKKKNNTEFLSLSNKESPLSQSGISFKKVFLDFTILIRNLQLKVQILKFIYDCHNMC